jgi:Asp-tRNA(Asn)/Glu-tRNA(Gln) amidotransferase A subunit family amidase
MELFRISATQAAAAVRSGKISSVQLVRACLDRINALEKNVQAWHFIDPEYALQQADAADRARSEGYSLGLLYGVPVGIKDIFDTADMPTENGTPLHAGRQPTTDATAVSLLRKSGAVIMGKTVTTELAVYAPAKTRNPHNPAHTPGGSSSGSAAAVAAGMVPLAIGSQTNGSVIRPASYCGVIGFKPTYGTISRQGMLPQSRPLDQVGVFSRTIEDAALIADQLMVFDDKDTAMQPRRPKQLGDVVSTYPSVTPRFAFVKSPVWHLADAHMQAALTEFVERLGKNISTVELPIAFNETVAIHQVIMEADLAKSFAAEYEHGAAQLSPVLCEMIERGQQVSAKEYQRAVAKVSRLTTELDLIFDRYDAVLTPAATGQAPKGLHSTGSPVFCTLWTLCGLPAISLPILKGPAGLPVGVQLVGKRGEDLNLFKTADWLYKSYR